MTSSFNKGYKASADMAGAVHGAQNADAYVSRISEACQQLEDNINAFKGFETDIKQLKGDVLEYYKAGTFNIEAAVRDSTYKTMVDRSHDYASADITSNWGTEYGLKACINGTASAKAQAVSHFQRFMEYRSISGRIELTFEDFLIERGINPNEVLASDPM